ncbi:MAG: FimV/HubP family polar landmark protein [Burkholderiaceae bacterium]
MGTSQGVSGRPGAVAVSLALGSLALLLAPVSAHSASVGHARLVSPVGQPLRITVPVHDVSAPERDSFVATVAPESAWIQAGLRPPVSLSSMQVRVQPGFTPATVLVDIVSPLPVTGNVADLLLDIQTAQGRQRHQVSLLAQGGVQVAPPAAATAASGAVGAAIAVRKGDTLFAIAQRHAVPGVSVYQMMVALYRANPKAFIHRNLNLVKAGATLQVPDHAALTALSDREARRIFDQHARAFALYRNRAVSTPDVAVQATQDAASGQVVAEVPAGTAPERVAPTDRLRLSEGVTGTGAGASSAATASGAARAAASPGASVRGNGQESPAAVGASVAANGQSGTAAASVTGNGPGMPNSAAGADDKVALNRAVSDAQGRVGQLEDNVRQLNEALKAQGQVAGELALQGAKALSDIVSDSTDPSRAGASGQASSPSVSAAAVGTAASGNNVGGVNGAGTSGNAGSNNGTTGAGTTGAGTTGNGGTSNGGNGAARAGADNGSFAGSGQASSAAGTGTGAGSGVTGGVQAGTGGGSIGAASGAVGAPSPNTAPPSDDLARRVAEPITQQAEKTVSWLQANWMVPAAGLLALLILIFGWLIRRGRAANEAASAGEGAITEAMIREKLEKIDLSLDESGQGSKKE